VRVRDWATRSPRPRRCRGCATDSTRPSLPQTRRIRPVVISDDEPSSPPGIAPTRSRRRDHVGIVVLLTLFAVFVIVFVAVLLAFVAVLIVVVAVLLAFVAVLIVHRPDRGRRRPPRIMVALS